MREKILINSTEILEILGTVGSPLIVISELIKNAIDAEATQIQISYNTSQNQIQITDNGVGMTEEEIRRLAQPGVSDKKVGENVRNKKGFYFTGSKGLGILSCFSLCNSFALDTATAEGEAFHVKYSRDGELEFDIIEEQLTTGTTIVLENVLTEDIEFLTSQLELRKLRHLSTYLFKNKSIPFPQIMLKIDDADPISILFQTDFIGMLYDVKFSFDKKTQKIHFKIDSESAPDICNKDVIISEFELQQLERVALEYYGIKKVIETRTNTNAVYSDWSDLERVPNFEGRILCYKGKKKDSGLEEYGAGVNVYVNEFALYNYLSEENDWLGLADYSQRKKNTNIRPHNVYGYVNFKDFNENEEELKISNERADFIQNQVFKKLMYLLKGVIMLLIINIDVAEKNPQYKVSDLDNVDPVAEASEKPSNAGVNADGEVAATQEELSQIPQDANSVADLHPFDTDAEETNVYRPEDIYCPKKLKTSGFKFTRTEGQIIEKLKNADDLSNKIYQLIYELSEINFQRFPCATAGIYRSLIDCSTRYFMEKHSEKLEYKEKNIIDNINNVLNFLAMQKQMDKKVKRWRETIRNRYLMDLLNEYMHNRNEIDMNFLEETWKTMKSYVIDCIS